MTDKGDEEGWGGKEGHTIGGGRKAKERQSKKAGKGFGRRGCGRIVGKAGRRDEEVWGGEEGQKIRGGRRVED